MLLPKAGTPRTDSMTRYCSFLPWPDAALRGLASVRGAVWPVSMAICLATFAPKVLRAQAPAETPMAMFAQGASTPASSSATPAPDMDDAAYEDDGTPAMFPHPETDRLWLSGQANVISQWHPAFY